MVEPSASFSPFLREHIDGGLGAAVDGIVQRDAVEAVFVGGLGGDGDFFDGAGVVIAAAGTHQRNLRRVGFAGLDEKILADANGLARFDAGDVIDAVLIHLDGAAIDVVLAAGELDLLPAIELDLAAGKRAIGGDFEFGFGAGDGAQIAAALFDLGRHAGPGGVMVGDLDLLHGGQIGDANVEVLRRHGAGGDVVFDVFGQAGKQKLIAAGETAGRFGCMAISSHLEEL